MERTPESFCSFTRLCYFLLLNLLISFVVTAKANATATGTSPRSTPVSNSGSSNHSRWGGWVAMETVVGCVLYTVMHLLLVST
ncbi:hypothetical protein BHE74_00052731 [Ensete ventricosum]|nr:hypothetical protein BHE74_00052731 [Ensete ventricosum]RZS04385.1 hypothetical protein BHM03_00034717 [Ensete ventricosum]